MSFPTRTVAAASATVVIAGVICGGAVIGTAHADTLAGAKARAAALTRNVEHLNTAVEVASQHYDAIESRLGTAVNSSLTADRQVAAAQHRIAEAQARVEQRVQVLYASAGSMSLFAAVLTGTPAQAVQEAQLSQTFLTSQTKDVSREERIATQAHQTAAVKGLSAKQEVRLGQEAAAARSRVLSLLAKEKQQLAAASATVKRLAAAQQRQAALADAAAFTSSLNLSANSPDMNTNAPNQIAANAIAWAKSRLGDPYVWGGTGPNDFDCSGLTQWSYAHAGLELPRVAAEQWYSGPHPPLNALEPGDLLFYAFDVHDPATIHHVTMYLGGGMMIAAPETGENVQIQPVYMDGLIGATRPWAKSISGQSGG